MLQDAHLGARASPKQAARTVPPCPRAPSSRRAANPAPQRTPAPASGRGASQIGLIRSKAPTAPDVPSPASTSGSADSSVCSFFRGKTIFLTGATGFLAKVLLEKLLREAPDVKHVYLLIQRQKDNTPQQRLEGVVKQPLFDTVRLQQNGAFEDFISSRLTPVEGSLMHANFGIKEPLLSKILAEADVVINSAATTTFDERFDTAVRLNTLGAKEVARFAESCPNLKCLIQVSTAFVNGTREGNTPERPFVFGQSIADEKRGKDERTLDVEAEIASALASDQEARAELAGSGLSGDALENAVTQRVKERGMSRAQANGWQDTYVFTKAMGEMLLGREAAQAGIPTAIVRPSIVESSIREPMVGWIEGIRMADPLIIAYGRGKMLGFPMDPAGILDVIPVDHVVNTILAATVATAHKQHGATAGGPPAVYQVATSTANPLRNVVLGKAIDEHFAADPFLDKSGKPIHVGPINLYKDVGSFVAHIQEMVAPVLAGGGAAAAGGGGGEDEALSPSSRKERVLAQTMIDQMGYLASIYSPYTFYRCRFGSERTAALYASLSPADQARFPFDVHSIDWMAYLRDVHIMGLRKFVLKGRRT